MAIINVLISAVLILVHYRWYWSWQDCSLGLNHTLCLYKEPAEGCIVSPLMTRDFNSVTRAVNKLRGDLARGEAMDKDGKFLPKAARMVRLVFDDLAAETALRWAEQCLNETEDLNRDDHRFRMAQHVEMKAVEKNTSSVKLQFADWEHIIKYIVNIGMSKFDPSYISMDIRKKQLDQLWKGYALMMYADAQVIGCAHAYRDEGEFYLHKYVCNIGPFDSPYVYKIGEPCSACLKDEFCSIDKLCVTKRK